MKTTKNLSIALAFALAAFGAGCAADSPDGGPGPGGTGTGSDDAPRELDPTGRYRVASTFDIATNMPGKVGEVTNAIINATDGANDPAEWIVDLMIAQISDNTIKSILNTAKTLAITDINQKLLQIAPDFVDTAINVGQDFGQMARNFGLNETLDVSGTRGAYSAAVSATGVHFKVDNVEKDIAFADHAIAPVSAMGVGLTLEVTGQLGIGEHKLPLAYGKILHIGLDEVIIPAVSSTATNLQTLFTSLIDCAAVGQSVSNTVYYNFGFNISPNVFKGACTLGLTYAANEIYAKIDAMDSSALEFGLVGTARALDSNNDQKVDKIQTGAWSGTLTYGGTPAPLAAATFTGTRM